MKTKEIKRLIARYELYIREIFPFFSDKKGNKFFISFEEENGELIPSFYKNEKEITPWGYFSNLFLEKGHRENPWKRKMRVSMYTPDDMDFLGFLFFYLDYRRKELKITLGGSSGEIIIPLE